MYIGDWLMSDQVNRTLFFPLNMSGERGLWWGRLVFEAGNLHGLFTAANLASFCTEILRAWQPEKCHLHISFAHNLRVAGRQFAQCTGTQTMWQKEEAEERWEKTQLTQSVYWNKFQFWLNRAHLENHKNQLIINIFKICEVPLRGRVEKSKKYCLMRHQI